MLRLTAVTKRFGERSVLNAVSLDIAAGEYVAVGITGASDPGGDLQVLVALIRERRAA